MRVSDSEMKIMRLLWERGAMTGMEVMESCGEDWKKTTVFTFLKRLCDKGMVTVRKEGKSSLYSAAQSEEDYKRAQSEEFLDDMYSGSVKSFLAALCGGEKLGKKDIDEIKEWFETL